MNLPDIRAFAPDDFGKIERLPEATIKDWEAAGRQAVAHWVAGPAVTAELDGEIMFCVGIDERWPGVGEVWFVMSPEAAKHPGVFWALRTLIDQAHEKGYHRLQAAVSVPWQQAARFAEWLGFEAEGYMEKFGQDGQDYLLYARVW